MQDLAAWVQDAILAIGLLASALIGLAVWQIKLLHSRIDKYHEELRGEFREHVRESKPVIASQIRLETLLKTHIGNGHKHRGDGD